MREFDRTTDALVIGSGVAGLVGSLVAREAGLDVLVVESTGEIGGSSALSGGGLWIPDNPLMRAAGVHDSYEEARRYLDDIVGDVGPASSAERREAFLREGPLMIEFLRRVGMKLRYGRGYPDYYPERPGGSVDGRLVEAALFDARRLGSWWTRVRGHDFPFPPVYNEELGDFARGSRTVRGRLTRFRVDRVRGTGRRLLGQVPLAGGGSLVGQLLWLDLERSVPIWTDSPMVELVVEGDGVAGAVIEHEGERVRVGARRGVLLAAGGFARNQRMREEHGPHPITTGWTSASPGDLGDAIRAGVAIGAATALLDEAWWGPAVVGPGGVAMFTLWERSFPSAIIVDGAGERYMNESASYVDCGHWQYARNEKVPAIPSWMVVDAKHRSRYPFARLLPGRTPESAIEEGWLKRAGTLRDLAGQAGVDPDGLERTVERFNRFAVSGRDEDFHRGDSRYDRQYGDPRVRPNPNLGTLDRPPYYATAIYPGDLGTKGGLLTDEHGRVLRDDGTPIGGLYAAGNTTASVMGRTYAGPGATLGPAATFAYVAMQHATRAERAPSPLSRT